MLMFLLGVAIGGVISFFVFAVISVNKSDNKDE